MAVEKVIVGTVCVGGTCAVGYGVYEFSKAKTLRDLLIVDHLHPLDETTPESIWTTLVTAYSAATEKKFSDLELKEPSDGTNPKWQQLKDRCMNALELPVEDEKLESLKEPTKEWCTKDSSHYPKTQEEVAAEIQVASQPG